MANSRSIDIQNSNITINANEVATLYKSINSDSIQIRNNTIEVNSNNTTVLYDIEFANVFMSYLSDSNNIIINSPNSIIANINNTIGSLSLTGTLNLTTNNLTIIKINNGSVTLGINISDLKTEKFNMINSTNSTVTLINNNINATVTENNGIILTNNSVLTSYNIMNGNIIKIKSTNSTPFIRIINSVADIQKTNITQNSSNTPIIKSIDSNITVKDFIYYVVNKYCYKYDYNEIVSEMIAFLKKEFELKFHFSNKNLNKRLIDVFEYRIKKNKPIIMIYCPEYLGAGCWGESNGLRYYINSNENIHTYEPHVHVQTFSKEYKDRFDIIKCELIKTKDNSKPLSSFDTEDPYLQSIIRYSSLGYEEHSNAMDIIASHDLDEIKRNIKNQYYSVVDGVSDGNNISLDDI